MATRRMFSRLITETDRFLSMTPAAQSLYFHLNMNADDDGFVASPKAVLSTTRARKQDLKMLEQEGLVLPFSSGILVITHWRVHNLIKKDRYHPTLYRAEKAQLLQTDGTTYGEKEENLEPEVRLDKERKGKKSLVQTSLWILWTKRCFSPFGMRIHEKKTWATPKLCGKHSMSMISYLSKFSMRYKIKPIV